MDEDGNLGEPHAAVAADLLGVHDPEVALVVGVFVIGPVYLVEAVHPVGQAVGSDVRHLLDALASGCVLSGNLLELGTHGVGVHGALPGEDLD